MRVDAGLLSLVFAFSLVLPPAVAQAPSQRSSAELEHFVLSMENVTQFFQAEYALEKLAKSHPEIARTANFNPLEPEPMAASVKRLSGSPLIVSTLKGSSLTPQSYVLVEFSYLRTAAAADMVDKLKTPPAEVAAKLHLNAANIAFLNTHRTELQALAVKYPIFADNE